MILSLRAWSNRTGFSCGCNKMMLNVTESWPELLLACLLIALSIWFWRKRHSTHTTNSGNLKDDANMTMTHTTESHQKPDHPDVVSSSAVFQSSAVHPYGCSVVLSANTGSTVNAPTLESNTFYGQSVFNFTTTSVGKEPMRKEPPEGHSDDSVLQKFLESHKARMKEDSERIFEGKRDLKYKIQLKKVYTQLFITEGELNKVNNEHETLKILKDKAFRVQHCQETAVNCNEIFSLAWKKKDEIKTVLTKGIAGIGKTVSVQKFILDWAEGEANQDIDCLFLLPFREINLFRETEYSLYELLLELHPQLEELDTKWYEDRKLAFIFDGLDESRLPLDFNSRVVKSIKKKASVDSLITNLIRGNLLPSALIWITSRPAAANQIPSEYVSLFTEIRGFTDQQKEEYFKKRISDETKAIKMISHIKFSRSLYIMCHIPVFCWITATVFQDMLVENQGEEIPKTLTEMYIHFLLIQMNMKNQKYEEKVEREHTKLMEKNRGMILKLAKLAFEQLKKENIMFYESDLKECGIDVNKDPEYTGMCAEIFKQESVLHEMKVYCFVHLSLQEFLAALHVFYSYLNKNKEDLQFFFEELPDEVQLDALLKKVIEKAKQSEKGHFDLFLRFLLGISHESNQKFLTGLLPHTERTKKSINKVIQHIRQMQNTDKGSIAPEKSINHFFCLLELKDSSLYNQVKKYLNVEARPDRSLSLSNCSALAYMLLMSEEVLDELNPKMYNSSPAASRRLVPAVRCCKKALFAGCELTESCCECISVALQAENSPLIELDLSDNYRLETAANLLSSGLKSSRCKLEILRLTRCHFTQNSCIELASSLSSVSAYLKKLDFSNNNLQDSGLNQLLLGLTSSHCKLESLRLSWCNLTQKSCELLSSFLSTSSELYLRELDLSNNDLQNTGVKLLSVGLENPKSRLEILRLSGCMITEEGCNALASALKSNSSYLRDLDLSYNNPGESGEKLLSSTLEDLQCKPLLKMDPKGEHFIKPGVKKYAVRLTLDPQSAHKQLSLSEDNRKVTYTLEKQDYPDHPDRFEVFTQVLCKESLSDRCYWEVEFKDSNPDIGVTYAQIERKGDDIVVFEAQAQLGLNKVSWTLGSSVIGYDVCHDSVFTNIPSTVLKSETIGVFLDWPAGVLSFYSISPEAQVLTHIHTFQTTFEKPLYPAFHVHHGSLSLCQLD